MEGRVREIAVVFRCPEGNRPPHISMREFGDEEPALKETSRGVAFLFLLVDFDFSGLGEASTPFYTVESKSGKLTSVDRRVVLCYN